MDLSLCKNVQIWPTSQTGEGIRGSRGNVPRAPRLLGSILALPEYREGACRTRQVSWGYQETLSRCNRGRPGYLQPVCVCVYVLCHVHNHEPIFTFSRNAHTRQLFITVPVACVTRGSGSSSMRQRGYGHHGGMGRQPQTTPTAATGNDGAPQWYGTAAPDHTSRPQRTPIAMARQARRARRQPSSSCIRRT